MEEKAALPIGERQTGVGRGWEDLDDLQSRAGSHESEEEDGAKQGGGGGGPEEARGGHAGAACTGR